MAKQSKNQDWNIRNSALRENVQNEKPVRVIRGWKGDPVWSPDWGFMYCGLYEVVAAWVEAGKSGFDVIRFAFKRLPDQPPLVNGKGQVMPEPDYASEEWKGWEARLTDERADEILEIKKEETGSDVELRVPRRARTQKDRLYVKVEGSDDIYMAY
jgi:SAD/SRA domain